jgi:hypothetical protein
MANGGDPLGGVKHAEDDFAGQYLHTTQFLFCQCELALLAAMKLVELPQPVTRVRTHVLSHCAVFDSLEAAIEVEFRISTQHLTTTPTGVQLGKKARGYPLSLKGSAVLQRNPRDPFFETEDTLQIVGTSSPVYRKVDMTSFPLTIFTRCCVL